MRKSFDDYTLLAGNYGLRGSLWKGPDHLLVVESKGFIFAYREMYRRIDYKNIQALTLTRTGRHVWWSVLLGLVLTIFTALFIYGLTTSGFDTFTWLMLGLGGVAAIPLSIHLIKGKTCVCSLQTAVLSLRLKPLKREKRARAVLADLNALCRHHQGEMPAESDMTPSVPMMPFTGVKPEWHGSKMVQWAFVLTLLWGVMFASELFVNSVPYFITGIVIALCALAIVIAGLAKAMRHRTQNGLVGLLWANLVTLLLGGLAYYGLFIAGMIMQQTKKLSSDPKATLNWIANLTLKEASWGAWPLIGLGIVTAVLALFGLIIASQRRAQAPAPVSNTPPTMES